MLKSYLPAPHQVLLSRMAKRLLPPMPSPGRRESKFRPSLGQQRLRASTSLPKSCARASPPPQCSRAQLPKELAAIYWPKNMYWRAGKPERFVRPLRWLLALLDDQVVDVEFAGTVASNKTYGHRVLHGDQPIEIGHPSRVSGQARSGVRHRRCRSAPP